MCVKCLGSVSADTIHKIDSHLETCNCTTKSLTLNFLEYDPKRITEVKARRDKINLTIRELIAKKIRSMFHNIL